MRLAPPTHGWCPACFSVTGRRGYQQSTLLELQGLPSMVPCLVGRSALEIQRAAVPYLKCFDRSTRIVSRAAWSAS